MRAVFVFLVVVNLAAGAALVWRLLGSESDGVGAVELRHKEAPAPSLVLLSEAGGSIVVKKQQSEVVRAPTEVAGLDEDAQPGGGAGQAACQYVGPFKALLRAEYFVEHLNALDVRGEVRTLQVPGERSYWVYLVPELSRKAALRRLHEIQANGVDSYVIPKGELENGISFGVFSREDEAQEKQSEIGRLGLEAKVQRIERAFEEIWVVIPQSEAQKIAEELWLELMNKEDGLERRQNLCSGVAS